MCDMTFCVHSVCDIVCSLVSSLTQGKHVDSGSFGEKITDGIDITTWVVEHNNESISFSVWDFAGQTVYYNTHQVKLLNVYHMTAQSLLILMISCFKIEMCRPV